MANTYTWRVPRVDSTPLIDGIALVQNEDPGEVEIVEVRAAEPSECAVSAQLGAAGALDLVRISAVVPSATGVVSPVKYDTDAADIPSQVEFRTSLLQVTESDVIRRVADAPQLTTQGAGSPFAAKLWNAFVPRADGPLCDEIWNAFVGPSSSEPLILREGEGFALVQRAGTLPHSMTVNITVRVVATGATYVYRTRDVGTMANRALWSLMNGSGSGVVLQIYSIQMSEDGTLGAISNPIPPAFRLLRVDGFVPSTEFTPSLGTAVSMDPARTMPTGIKLYTEAFKCALVGYFDGVVYNWDTIDSSVANVTREQRSGCFRQIVRVSRPNRIGDAVQTPDNGFDVFKASVGKGIVLRRGEGLAIAGGRAGAIDDSQLNYFDLRITFVHRPANYFATIGNNRLLRAS